MGVFDQGEGRQHDTTSLPPLPSHPTPRTGHVNSSALHLYVIAQGDKATMRVESSKERRGEERLFHLQSLIGQDGRVGHPSMRLTDPTQIRVYSDV